MESMNSLNHCFKIYHSLATVFRAVWLSLLPRLQFLISRSILQEIKNWKQKLEAKAKNWKQSKTGAGEGLGTRLQWLLLFITGITSCIQPLITAIVFCLVSKVLLY